MRTIPNADNFRAEDYRQIVRIESCNTGITESEVLEASFTFDSTMVEGSSFQIGTAVADEINVTVVGSSGIFDAYIDDTFEVYIAAIPSGGNRSEAEWVFIGTYVVAELDTSYAGQARVKFQDMMVTLDVPVDFQSGTLYANLQNLGLTLSLTQEEITFLSGLSVLNRQTMTKRDFIRGCALLMWENAYLKPDGKLAFRSITTTAQTFTPSDRFSSELGDEVTIGPVRVIDDSGAVIYTMGSASGQTIEISSTTSPMISLIGSIEGLATYYSTATIPGRGIADFSYTPLTMSLLSTWALEPGDVVSYIDKDNNTYTSVVTSVAHVLNGASACTSAGEAKVRQSQQIPVQTDETRAVIQQLETGIDTAQSTASEAMPKYGVCSTSASTATKEVNVGAGFVLREGARVAVLMQNSNTSTGTLKLKVNTSTAKDIVDSEGNALGMINGQTTSWLAGSMVTFVYTRNKTNTDYVWRVDDNFALTRINNILTDNIVGTNGWINLGSGTFNFGTGKLVWDIPPGGSTPSLSVQGTIESTNGHIGSWNIGANLLSTDVTIGGTTYKPFMQVPNGDTVVNAFGVTATSSGTTTYPFRVTYDGRLYATKGGIGGWTIDEDQLYSSANDGTNTYTAYMKAYSQNYYGSAFGITSGSSTLFSVSYNGSVGATEVVTQKINPGDSNPKIIVTQEIQSHAYNLYMSDTEVTTLNTKYGLSVAQPKLYSFLNNAQAKVSGMSADGSTATVADGTWTSATIADALAANHRYLAIINVEFPSNATGIRAIRGSINGSTAGNIATDRRQALSGYSTFCRAEFWIQPDSSSRSFGIDMYQNSGSPMSSVTFRYQLIDFGV